MSETEQGVPPGREAVAANLVVAAHVYMLTMQLQGRTVSVAEAIAAVRGTWQEVLRDDELLSLPVSFAPTRVQAGAATFPPTQPAPETDGDTAARETFLTSNVEPVAAPSFADDAAVTASSSDPLIGTVLDGRYRILSLLGEGGMGKVYLGEQVSTGRKTAVKVLSGRRMDENRINYIRHEAMAQARLNHPHIAQIYDASVVGGHLYISMEYIEGESLRRYIQRQGALPLDVAVSILRQTCDAVGTAHASQIIHRDLKPENIMLLWRGADKAAVNVLDFGVAIIEGKSANSDFTQTGAGEFAGTPLYMSPEQVMQERLTTASDVYSLGLIGYEMLTGRPPFTAETMMELFMKQLRETPAQPTTLNPHIPQSLEGALLRALEKEPGRRFETATEFGRWL